MNKTIHEATSGIHARRGGGAGWRPDGEKIGVHCIRLRHLQLNARAVVGSFFVADKLLLAWAVDLKGVLACEFEIVYNDERTVSGHYQFRRKGTSRPALMQFVREAATAMCAGSELACPLHGLAQREPAFLEQYDTEDFALA